MQIRRRTFGCFLTAGLIVLYSSASLAFSIDRERAVSALKEALSVGIQNAVTQVGSTDGFYQNPEIKIPLPETLQQADALLQKFGAEGLSEMLVRKMNRAAETAAPQGLSIFMEALKSVKFEDAMKILSGDDTAATTYLKDKTSDALETAFLPIVKDTLEEVGAIKIFNDYKKQFSMNPLLSSVDLNLEGYVTAQAVEGIFLVIAEEEKKIRKDPAARVTDLLESVFGNI